MSAFGLRGNGARTLWRNFVWLPPVLVFYQYFYHLRIISGRSMQPTLNPEHSLWRDVAIFNRSAAFAVERGDIVALKNFYFRSPQDPRRILIKRVIAIEGDTIQTLPPYPDAFVTIPNGHVWVEGDEAFHSLDSNHLGPIPAGLIDSRLSFVVWPLPRFGAVSTAKNDARMEKAKARLHIRQDPPISKNYG